MEKLTRPFTVCPGAPKRCRSTPLSDWRFCHPCVARATVALASAGSGLLWYLAGPSHQGVGRPERSSRYAMVDLLMTLGLLWALLEKVTAASPFCKRGIGLPGSVVGYTSRVSMCRRVCFPSVGSPRDVPNKQTEAYEGDTSALVTYRTAAALPSPYSRPAPRSDPERTRTAAACPEGGASLEFYCAVRR